MTANDVAVDSGGQRLVVCVAGEIAIFEHLKPDVGLLGGWNDPLGEGFSEGWAWSSALVSLALKIEFECFPYRFKSEFKPLDRGIANDFGFGLRDRFC